MIQQLNVAHKNVSNYANNSTILNSNKQTISSANYVVVNWNHIDESNFFALCQPIKNKHA